MHALEIMKKVGNIWQKLGPKEKQRFEAQAEVDKQRFLKEIRIFKEEMDSSKMLENKECGQKSEIKSENTIIDANMEHNTPKVQTKVSQPSINLKTNLTTNKAYGKRGIFKNINKLFPPSFYPIF